jgi:Aerotolerance regulator N-terminal/von Willebrand factor type A domain
MSFLSPFFLLGLAALAAPVLVHLVRRTRARRVQFPALVFVRRIPQRTIRRRTLHNLLLMLLRCLVVLLIVFAFTRPFFTGSRATAETESAPASLILIDSSLSMRRADHFAQARRRAEAIIGTAGAEERFALLAFGKRYDIISRFTTDRARVLTALASLSAGFEGTDYEQALRGAESLFAELKTSGQKRIILISDFQASGWAQASQSFKLRNDVRLIPVDVGGGAGTENLSVLNVEARPVVYGQKYTDKLAVHVSNFGEQARERLQLDLKINDQTVERRELSLAARDRTVVEFSGFNLAEGPNRCAVTLGSADDFTYDNQFYFTLRREAPAGALIVERAVRGRSESFYLQNALATGDALPFSFAVKSAGAVNPADVSSYALIILNDTGALPGMLAESLNKYVEGGGHLVIAAGPHSDAGSFNQAFQKVAPASLGAPVQLERGESLAITDAKMEHPVFETFQGGGRLTGARFFGYVRAEPLEGAAVLARFEDGSPVLVERGVGAGGGRVLLFLTSFDTGWTDLPLTPLYLPLVQQMVRYLGQREESVAWHPLGQTFRVEKATGEASPAVDLPSGARLMEQSLTPDGDLLVTGREPGFYRLRYGAGPQFAAVNVDGSEGDFARLNVDEFLSSLTGGGGAAETATANDRLSDEEIEARQRVWWPLLLLALLLLITEALVARRTKIVKMIG